MLHQSIVPTQKWQGSVIVWGCFGNNQVGDLVKIEKTVKKKACHRILSKQEVTSGKRVISPGLVMQQDNDLKYSSKLYRGY